MIRGAIYFLVGLLITPFVWLFSVLRRDSTASPVPKHFKDLADYFWGKGLRASLALQDIQVNHVESMASLKFGLNPSKLLVVTITKSATPEQAALAEAEAAGAPQFSGVRRNGTLVMACTFAPPDPDLEARITSAFMEFANGT